jgi:pimeloyl-ACP methyl ester carboxylesterase
MHMKTILIFLAFFVLGTFSFHPEAKLEFLAYCKYYNYPAEAHKVVT